MDTLEQTQAAGVLTGTSGPGAKTASRPHDSKAQHSLRPPEQDLVRFTSVPDLSTHARSGLNKFPRKSPTSGAIDLGHNQISHQEKLALPGQFEARARQNPMTM
jgi:hypothetical protein